MGQRRKAREMAVQTLYALDFCEVDPEFKEYSLLNEYPAVLQELSEGEHVPEGSPVIAFAEDLIKNTLINLEDIEIEIDKHSVNWPHETLAQLDRGILHVAIYELLYTDTPAPVVINEAIEIAKKYCSESTGKLINGILDAINKEARSSK